MICSKGKVFLKNLRPGTPFKINGQEGILLKCDMNADVIITDLPKNSHYTRNESYYKGRHSWSAHTEVEVT